MSEVNRMLDAIALLNEKDAALREAVEAMELARPIVERRTRNTVSQIEPLDRLVAAIARCRAALGEG